MKYLQEVLPVTAARISTGASLATMNLNSTDNNQTKPRTRVSNLSSTSSNNTPKASHYPPHSSSTHHQTPYISPRNNNYQPYTASLAQPNITLPNLPPPPTIPLVQPPMFFPPVSSYGPSSYLSNFNSDNQFRPSMGSNVGGYSSGGIANINIRPFEPNSVYTNNISSNEVYNFENFLPSSSKNDTKLVLSPTLPSNSISAQNNQIITPKSNEGSVDLAEFQKLQHTVREMRRFLKAEFLGKSNVQESVSNIVSKPQRSYISKENFHYMAMFHPTLLQVVELFPLREYEMRNLNFCIYFY